MDPADCPSLVCSHLRTAFTLSSTARMAVFLRARFPGSRERIALVFATQSPHAEASLGRLLVKGSPRVLHTTAPARTSRPAHEHRAADGAKLADAAEETAGRLQEELFRVLCQPRPSSPSLVALVRGIVAAGAAPSLAAVQALADHLTAAKDAKSLKVRGRGCTHLTFSGWRGGLLLPYRQCNLRRWIYCCCSSPHHGDRPAAVGARTTGPLAATRVVLMASYGTGGSRVVCYCPPSCVGNRARCVSCVSCVSLSLFLRPLCLSPV